MKTTTAQIDWPATLTEALNAPGSLGNTYRRYYDYSFLNQIRLLLQGVREPVATYNRWHELGRQVRKGSKAKVVLAPVMVNRDAKDGNGNIVIGSDGNPRKRQVLVGFRDSRTVFGFSDTDGDDLPSVELPGWDTQTALATLPESQRLAFELIKLDGLSVAEASAATGTTALAVKLRAHRASVALRAMLGDAFDPSEMNRGSS